ncbi:hypothetical protein LguiB_010648 [Lonicera macranthoides]
MLLLPRTRMTSRSSTSTVNVSMKPKTSLSAQRSDRVVIGVSSLLINSFDANAAGLPPRRKNQKYVMMLARKSWKMYGEIA